MQDKMSGRGETLCRTADCRGKSDGKRQKQQRHQGTTNLLESLKGMVRTKTMGQGNVHKQGLTTTAANRGTKIEVQRNAWQTSTLSSPEQLRRFREQQHRQTHELMLRQELDKFRVEVERKFRASEVNKDYTFPRPAAQDGCIEVTLGDGSKADRKLAF